MKLYAVFACAGLAAVALAPAPASAGCLKSGIVGGIVGHFAGHHGAAGAAAGCAFGSWRKHARNQRAYRNSRGYNQGYRGQDDYTGSVNRPRPQWNR